MKSKTIRFLYIGWKILCYVVICAFMAFLGFYLYAYITPKIDVQNSNRVVMYDVNDEVFYQSTKTSSWVKLSEISEYAVMGIVDTEDKNFYSHNGFDYLRIMKAFYNDIKARDLKEGASTISQQYIKNLFLTFDKTWERKLEEAYLT